VKIPLGLSAKRPGLWPALALAVQAAGL